ncbi:MAG: PilZ domain-containing protein [Solirubrobacteraceae bacterium]|jgi:hypothetical protein
MSDRQHQNLGLPALAGASGRLLRGAGQDIPVEVVWQSRDQLTLELSGEGPISFPAVEELVLERFSRRGLVRLSGEVSALENGRLRFAVHDVVEVEQRRSFVRVRVSRPVRIVRETDGRVSYSFALDLSGGGLLLAGPENLEPGEQISFRLRLDAASEPIVGMASVVRVGAGHPAVTFDSIAEDDRDRLVHFIFDRERSARHLQREARPDAGDDAHQPGGAT